MKKFFDKINGQTSIAAVALFAWVLLVCIVPNIWLSFTESLTFTEAVANVALPLGAYGLLLSLSKKIGRSSLWMTPIMAIAAFQVALLYMYGRSVIAVDMFLNVATTNPGEVSELMGNMLPVILVLIVAYMPPVVMSVVAVIKRWQLPHAAQKLMKQVNGSILFVGIVFFVVSLVYSVGYNPLVNLYPLNVCYNIGLAVDRTSKLANYSETSADYSFSAHSSRHDSIAEVYVAVVGETSRADNWQLFGYGRPTTPELMNRSGLVAFGKAFSQSNTTHKSVPLLLSALSADDYGDSIYVTKSFITGFKEAGFYTAFISNQNRNHSFIDRFGKEADTYLFIRDKVPLVGSVSYDSDVLPYIDNLLAEGHKKLLIVVHTYGSHFNYTDRYPANEAYFKPDGPAKAIQKYRKEQVNAYDNTIRFTSKLLASVIEKLESRCVRSAMIYTSDHGEDLFDDSRNLFLHASPCPSYFQIHVPFLVWFSPQLIEAYPNLMQSALNNTGKVVASSEAYFHTLMQLAGIESPKVNDVKSVVSHAYCSSSLNYLNDHNEKVSLREAGLLDLDFVKLDSLLQCK